VIWASVATGKLPNKHGITGFTSAARATGDQLPFTSNLRRAQAVWNILGERERRVAVVGWWTTWPAEPLNGVMVSDRMQYNRFNLWFGAERAGGDLPAQTHPPELFAELVSATKDAEELEEEFFRRFAGEGQPPSFDRDLHDPWYELLLAYARDRAYAEMLERILRDESFDFVAYYVNGTDIASHYFWKYLYPEDWDEPIPPEELERYGDVIAEYYAYVDESIAPLLAEADERCLVILLSDHGFAAGHRPDTPHISGTHTFSAPPGVIALAGAGLPAGVELGRTTVMDVAPTILHAVGEAVGRDMDGSVMPLVAALDPDRPARFVESYETGVAPDETGPVSSEYDEAILEKLRALGYIDGGN
jgi:arylsulfatase A-like enzyme